MIMSLRSGWVIASAERVCGKVQSGGTPKEGFESCGIPFLKVYNIVNQEVCFHHRPQYVSQAVHTSALAKSRVLPGDVLMNIVGPPLGKVAIVPSIYLEWNINQALALFRPSAAIDSKWIYYFLCSGQSVEGIINETKGSAGQVNISLSQCRDFDFPVPPLAEQHRIVAKIDSLSSKSKRAREHLDHIPRLVDKYKQAVLAAAFRDELTKIAAPRVPLSSVVAVRTGPFGSALHRSEYVEQGVPIVNPMHIVDGHIVHSNETSVTSEKAGQLSEFRLIEGDVVLARRGVMGRCAVVTTEQVGFLCGTGSMIVRPDQKRLLSHYLQRYLSSPDVVDALEQGAVGTTMVNLNQSILLKQVVPLPTMTEQLELVRRIDIAFAWIDRLAAEATGARKLIDRLDQAVLAKAFRGELVPQDPNDEPASVLLERIRAEREAAPAVRPRRGRAARS